MNRNLSPDEFSDQFLDLGPDAGQTLEFRADRDARAVAGLPGSFEGIAGAEAERRAVSGLISNDADALFDDDLDAGVVAEAEERLRRTWSPPPGRLN